MMLEVCCHQGRTITKTAIHKQVVPALFLVISLFNREEYERLKSIF
jgi:hypothetical protein